MQNGGSETTKPLAALWRIATGAAALVALALIVPAGAAADRGKDKDPRGDFDNQSGWATEDVDIVKLKHKHRGNKLKHVVKLDGTSSSPKPGENEPNPPSLAINTGPGAGQGCGQLGVDATGAEYVIASIARSRPALVDCNDGSTKRVKSKKVGEHKFVYTFKKWKIGKPGKYGWRAETAGFDVAPNDSNWLRHQLKRKGNKGGKRWKHCGDMVDQGAGAYNVRGRNVGCPRARRVTDRYMNNGGPKRLGRWRCKDRRLGVESWKAKCVLRKQGKKNKVVKFKYGA